MHTLELTTEEYNAVMDMRRKRIRSMNLCAATILSKASLYCTWLYEKDTENTFGTFCDDYRYCESGENREEVYNKIVAIIEFARSTVTR